MRPARTSLQKSIDSLRTRAWFSFLQRSCVEHGLAATHPSPGKLCRLVALRYPKHPQHSRSTWLRWSTGESNPEESLVGIDRIPVFNGSRLFYLIGPIGAPLFSALLEENPLLLLKAMPERFISAFALISSGLKLSSVFEDKLLETASMAAGHGGCLSLKWLDDESREYRLAELAGCFMLLRYVISTLHRPDYVLRALSGIIDSPTVRSDLAGYGIDPRHYTFLMASVIRRDVAELSSLFGNGTPTFLAEMSKCSFGSIDHESF